MEIVKLTDLIHSHIKPEIRAMYLVGGIVRDDLLNRDSKDVDICLDTGFKEMLRIYHLLLDAFPEGNVQFIERFHNVKFNYGSFKIDLVPFRKESYSDFSNYPIISEGTFIDDVLRRDFTINSIYMKYLGDGRFSVFDPLGGVKAIDNQVLILNYPYSFTDDPTRMIRLFTYQYRLGFMIDPQVIKKLSPVLMKKINPTLMFSSIQDVLKEPAAEKIIASLIEWHLLDAFGITHSCEFDRYSSVRDRWEQLIGVNPKLIKTFEDLGIYSKLLEKIRKG